MDLRRLVGHRPLLMPAASVILEDGDGRVLLQLRADNGLWCYHGGAVELDDGAGELADGAQKLKDGADELDDGAQKLYDGTGDLVDGVDELYDGAGELKDGLNKFNDEAIQKLLDFLDGDIKGLMDRADAMIDLAKGYAGYSGIAEGKKGVTQFIIKADGI